MVVCMGFFCNGFSITKEQFTYAFISPPQLVPSTYSEPSSKMDVLTQDPSIYFFDIGLFTGFIFILLVYSFLIFVNVKQPVFLWFFAYTFLVSVYLSFSEHWLVLWNESWLTYFNILNSLFILYAFKSFFQEVLNTELMFKAVHRWMNFLFLVAVGAVFLQFLFPQSIVLIVLSRLVFSVVIGLVYSCVFNNSEIASMQYKLLHISILALALAGISLTLRNIGVQSPVNLLLLGIIFLVLHILCYSMVMLYRVKKLNDENDSLWQDIRQTKNQLLEAHFVGVAEEKTRVMNEIQSTILLDLDTLVIACKEKGHVFAGPLSSVRNDLLLVLKELNPYKAKNNEKLVHKVNELVKMHETDDLLFNVVHFTSDLKLSQKVEDHLYRIFQEAINNIEKYAHATKVEIQILLNGDGLILSIEDNGVGFDVKKNKDGIGILNMRNRVLAIKGSFNIFSASGKGTSIIITLNM